MEMSFVSILLFTIDALIQSNLESKLMILIDQDLIPKKDRGAYNHV
jgi:hypothetical protein